MKPKNKIKFFSAVILSVLFFLLFLGIFITKYPAQSEEKPGFSQVRGQALWNDGHGYVYFNCLDYMVGEQLNFPGNLTDGFQFSYNGCALTGNYGVYIDSNNNFYGKAWNLKQGFISFEARNTPEDDFRVNCKDCNPGACSACYNPLDQRVYGYAYIEKSDQWINLYNLKRPLQIQNYDIDSNPIIAGNDRIKAGDFVFNAYETKESAYLSFNCETAETGDYDCSNSSNYKVYISNLQLGRLIAPNMNNGEPCGQTGKQAKIIWNLKSGQIATYDPITHLPLYYESRQLGFDLVVGRNNSFPASGNSVCSLSFPAYSASTLILNETNCPRMDYDSNYYWWIRLYDKETTRSTAWYQFGNPGEGIISESNDGDPDGNPLTFTTYKHDFPRAFFIWDPSVPVVGTSTLFTSRSLYSSKDAVGPSPISGRGSARSLQMRCSGSDCSYLWSTDPPPPINAISSSTNMTTTIVFGSLDNVDVSLRVYDRDGYSCSTSTRLNANYEAPIWREIRAQ